MTLTVRQFTKSDAAQWGDLWRGYLKFYASTGVASAQKLLDTDNAEAIIKLNVERFLDPESPINCFVAELTEDSDCGKPKLVGFATTVQHKNTWSPVDKLYLNDLYVSENCRCGGVGRALFEQGVYKYADYGTVEGAEEALKKLENSLSVYWRTQSFNHRAQLLYTKVGYKDGFVTYGRK